MKSTVGAYEPGLDGLPAYPPANDANDKIIWQTCYSSVASSQEARFYSLPQSDGSEKNSSLPRHRQMRESLA